MAPDASGLRQLTFSQGFDGDPAWSDDGNRLAFETTRNGSFDIYSIRSDGTGQARLTALRRTTPIPPGRRTERRSRSRATAPDADRSGS